jgi:hypothetical protein
MRVRNPDCSPARINRGDAAPTVPAASVKQAAQPEASFAAVKSLDSVLVQINVTEEISVLVNFH